MQGVFSLKNDMKKNIILFLLVAVSSTCYAQSDSVSIKDILERLSKLEQENEAIFTDSASVDESTYLAPAKQEKVEKSESKFIEIIDTTVLQPVVKFDTASYNVGSIDQGDVVIKKFTFTNVGTADLEIRSVSPDCSCTSPEWSATPIKPGEKGYILATYDSKDDIGKFLKTLTVIHNAGDGWSFVELRGFVAPKL